MKMICKNVEMCDKSLNCPHSKSHPVGGACTHMTACCVCVPVKGAKPYFANARVGDEVVDFATGMGEIQYKDHGIIRVGFHIKDDKYDEVQYGLDGKLFNGDIRQSLYYSGTTFTVNDAGEPKRTKKVTVWVNFYQGNEAFWHKGKCNAASPGCIAEAVPVEIEVPEDMKI